MSDPVLVDAHGVRTPLGGELLLAVAHAFTPEADAVLARAAEVRGTGKAVRVVSVDSDVALAAWLEAAGLEVAVGSDLDGELARRVGRWDEAACAWRPGWVQLGGDGQVLAAGDDALPPALRTFLQARAAPPAAPAPAGATPPWRWIGLAAAGVAVAAVLVWPGPPAEVPAAGPAASPGASPPAGAPAGEVGAAAARAPDPASVERVKARAKVGGGWFAVPAKLSGTQVRWVGEVLEVAGGADEAAACLGPDSALGAGVVVSGEWALDAVGSPETKGARVMARLLDESGRILPAKALPGGPQVTVANGRGQRDWAPFSAEVPAAPGAAKVRVCVDNRAGAGVVRVRGLVIAPR